MNRIPVPADRLPVFDAVLGCYRLPITRGRFALIDAIDVERVSDRQWQTVRKNERNNRRLVVQASYDVPLGRHILQLAEGDGRNVIHLNDDPFDFRRANIRAVDGNSAVTQRCKKRAGCSSQYRGVHYDKKRDRWSASITIRGEVHRLGRFYTEFAAACAYDDAAERFHGELARLNFPHQEAA